MHRFNNKGCKGIQVLYVYSDVFGLDPARVTHLHHRLNGRHVIQGPHAKDRASPIFKYPKSAAIGKRTAVRMLSFTEAHKPTNTLTDVAKRAGLCHLDDNRRSECVI